MFMNDYIVWNDSYTLYTEKETDFVYNHQPKTIFVFYFF